MALTVVGINHRGAPLDIRERIAYRPSEIGDAIVALRDEAALREAVVLSTCNRTEIYLVEDEVDAAPAAWTALSARLGAEASGYGYVRRDREAVTHLFRVASGLDSMVLGEAQIHGQVRDAWETSRTHSGPMLNRLFQTSLLVAGRVRNETSIARGAASVSSASVQLAKQIFGSLAGKRAMVLGAGEMAELALECLADQGVRTSIVANRTFERAAEVAERHGAVAMHYDECWTALADVDVLVCSTAAPHAVVFTEHVRPALDARGDRPLCILDIALPRDVDPSVGELDNVFLYNLDDLQAVVSANIERRRAELPSAEDLIAGEVDRYWEWVAGLAAVPVLTEMRERMDEVRGRELDVALRRLRHLPEGDRAVIEELSKTLMNKFLHSPTVRLRAAAANGRGLGVVDTVRYLFGLETRERDE
jgi:glutamyl-tRNA reductase